MTRRDFLGVLGAVAALPSAALAQQRIPIVGFVGFASAEVDTAQVMEFRKALAALDAQQFRQAEVDIHTALRYTLLMRERHPHRSQSYTRLGRTPRLEGRRVHAPHLLCTRNVRHPHRT